MASTATRSEAERIIQTTLSQAGVELSGNHPWDMQVHDPRFFSRVLAEGSMGLGDSYVDGWWDAEDLATFFERVLLAGLDSKMVWNAQFIFQIVSHRLLNMQNRERSWKVAKEHYDLGNDLYEAMLGRTMQYTCSFWKDVSNLDEAQDKKMDLICRKLMLKPGMRVLDTGCGFGTLAKYMAEKYGVSVFAVTLSKQQAAYGQKVCQGLPVEIRLQDYRDITESDGPFDRVASIGIMEHVGPKNYRSYLEQMHRLLKDDGFMLLHTIGSNTSKPYLDPWINKYIFPNGVLPSVSQIAEAADHLFLLEDWHNFGFYYSKTLEAWFANFDRHWPQLKGKYGERFYRMWKYYLLSCVGGFRSRSMQLWQIALSKRGVLGGYEGIR